MSGGSVLLGIYGPATALTTVGPRHSFHHLGTILYGSRWDPFPLGCSSKVFMGQSAWTFSPTQVQHLRQAPPRSCAPT